MLLIPPALTRCCREVAIGSIFGSTFSVVCYCFGARGILGRVVGGFFEPILLMLLNFSKVSLFSREAAGPFTEFDL